MDILLIHCCGASLWTACIETADRNDQLIISDESSV